ncbi:MAG: hypothetical protein KatS3mg062_1282 [Tepidiforma sp.]|nr:MAG: hypothetical protein KatS3mg062_1282 [Tepidiforma sp.]
MKRRTLDIILATGGLGITALLVALGIVLSNQVSWGRDYVKQQLSDQRITFATVDALSDEEKNWKPGSSCLIKYAGEQLTTGKQAECYANYYIAMHMRRAAANAAVDGQKMGWDNETYATMGPIVTDLRNKVNAAKQAGDTAEAERLQKQLDAATSLRSTFQTGETLRGLLLTTYGFSVITDRVQVAAYISYLIAAVMFVLSVAGYIHAFRTPADRVVLAPNPVPASH